MKNGVGRAVVPPVERVERAELGALADFSHFIARYLSLEDIDLRCTATDEGSVGMFGSWMDLALAGASRETLTGLIR